MPSLIWIEGFEHGVLSTAGAGLFDVVQNAPTADSTIKRTGAYSIRFYKTSAAACFVDKNIGGSPTYLVGRFYVYFTTLPSTGTTIFRGYTASGVSFYITYNSSATRLEAYCATGGTQAGPTVTTGVWYRVEFRFYCGGTTFTIDWQTATGDGTPTVHTQATATGQTASTFSTVTLGSRVSCTLDMYEDDVVLSTTTGDYPIGKGGVLGYSPNADGTHNNGPGYLDTAAGQTIDGSTYFAYSEVDEVPISEATTYVKAEGVDDGSDYVRANFANTSETIIHGVMGFLAYKSSGTAANSAGCRIWNSEGSSATLFEGDMSESSNMYKSALVPTPTGGWNQTEVNAIYATMGYATDATPNPYWLNLMIQVAYAPASGYSLSCEGGSYVLTGSAMTPKRNGKLVLEAGSYSLTGQAIGTYYGRKLAAEAGAYTLTGQNTSLRRAARLMAEAGSYILTGQNVTLIYVPGGGAYTLLCEAGSYALTGSPVGLRRNSRISLEPGAYTLTGQSTGLRRNALLVMGGGVYTLSGGNVTLTYSGAPPVTSCIVYVKVAGTWRP